MMVVKEGPASKDRIATMAITTMSSMSVNPRGLFIKRILFKSSVVGLGQGTGGNFHKINGLHVLFWM
jgi:hypothetical protein